MFFLVFFFFQTFHDQFIAESQEPYKKRLKTIETTEKTEEDHEEMEDEFDENADESGLYQHIKEAEKGCAETVDSATHVCGEFIVSLKKWII